jgi:hypothetical protein
MAKFSVGDKVRWNSEGGEVEGTVKRVHTKDVEFMGRMRRCSKDEPQYEVQSDNTDARAMHKEEALSQN